MVTDNHRNQLFGVMVSFQKVGGDILRQAQDAHPELVEGCLTPDY